MCSEKCFVFHCCSLSIIYHLHCWHRDLWRLFPLHHVPNQFILGKPTLNSFGIWDFYGVPIFYLNWEVLKPFGFTWLFYGHNKFLFLFNKIFIYMFPFKNLSNSISLGTNNYCFAEKSCFIGANQNAVFIKSFPLLLLKSFNTWGLYRQVQCIHFLRRLFCF